MSADSVTRSESAVGAEWAWLAAGAIVTAFWAAIAQWGDGSSPVTTTSMGATAATATAALVLAGWAYRPDGSVLVGGAALALLPMAVAASSTGTSAGFLVVVLFLLAAGDVVVEERRAHIDELWAPAAVLLGTILLLAAMLVGPGDPGRWALPAADRAGAGLALCAAAVLLAAAALGPPRLRCVAGAGLLVGVVAAPSLPALSVAIVGGVLAAAAAAVLPSRPSLALGLLGLAATAYGPARPAGMLLCAAAALALTVPWHHPATAALGVPGGAALVAALMTTGLEAEVAVLALAGALSAGALIFWLAGWKSWELPRDSAWWRALPGLALAAWLVIAPGTWEWTGQVGTGPYDRGAAVAASVGLSTLVLLGALRLRPTL